MNLADFTKILIIGAGLLLPGLLLAQYYDDPGLGQKPVAGYPQDYKPLGIRAGAFMLHPAVQLTAEWTDNVFFTKGDKKSDVIYHIRPYITAQSTWSRHSLNITLAADYAHYNDYSFQDYTDYFLTITGRLDVKNRSYTSYGATAMRLHEGRNNRNAEQGFEPTIYYLYGANLGYDHTFNRLSLGATLTFNRLDFDNAYSLVDGVINNQDRDRDTYNWSARAAYQFRAGMQAYAAYSGGTVKYKDETDRNDYDRSGDGYAISGGLAMTLTGKLDGDVYARYVRRSYEDPALPDTSGWGLGAGLTWTPTYLTSVYAMADTSVQETTSRYSSGYLRTLYSFRVDHELTRFIQINGFVSYSNNDYQQIANAPPDARSWDHVFRSGIGLNWFINRYLFLNASYDYAKLDTNAPDNGYTANSVWLTLGIER